MSTIDIPEIIPDENKKLLGAAIEAAQKAGAMALQFREKYLEISTKKDGSVVTQADIECQKLIQKILTENTSYKLIGEEDFEEFRPNQILPEDLNAGSYWLVDPIDGTHGYSLGNDEFCINIALIVDGYPKIGVVYVPTTAETFFGIANIGSWKIIGNEIEQIFVTQEPNKLRVLCSSHYINVECLYQRIPKEAISSITPLGSAIKMLRIAEGAADYHLRTGPTMKWDTAAPQAILEGAGGQLLDLNGTPLNYAGDSWTNPFFEAHSICSLKQSLSKKR